MHFVAARGVVSCRLNGKNASTVANLTLPGVRNQAPQLVAIARCATCAMQPCRADDEKQVSVLQALQEVGHCERTIAIG